MKTNSKSKENQKKYYYDLFWKLYDYECMCLGKRWIERIKLKHYSFITMKKTCIILKWFNDNFNKNEYYMCLATSKNASFRVFVYDLDDKLIKFVCFGFKNKLYVPTWGIESGEYENVDQCNI